MTDSRYAAEDARLAYRATWSRHLCDSRLACRSADALAFTIAEAARLDPDGTSDRAHSLAYWRARTAAYDAAFEELDAIWKVVVELATNAAARVTT